MKRLARQCLCALLCAMALGAADAHLMVAQTGTLNIVGDGAFLVLSLPVSAFQGVDDDGDGLLSVAEMRAHAGRIQAQVEAGVQLLGPAGTMPLQGLMLNLAPPDNAPASAARQLVVMGRFALAGAAHADDGDAAPLSLQLSLFGSGSGEDRQDLTVTRRPASQWARFTPEQPSQALFPAAGALFAAHLRLGAVHVLGGFDHLLFLLVVLAAGWGWRHLAAALSCFTAGHALTFAASVWGGLAAPAAIVEPAIAATIVGMAGFDLWTRRSARPPRQALRLGLVFGCALIHGLGLAGALSHLGVDSRHLLWSLAGFNTGIELAQLGVALLAALAAVAVRLTMGPGTPALATRLASVAAVAIGSLWLVERVAQAA